MMPGDGSLQSASDAPVEEHGAAQSGPGVSSSPFRGRYGRTKFWLFSLGLLALLILMMMPLAAMNNPTGGGNSPLVLIAMAALFFGLFCKLIAHRLHDLDRSGWWSFVLAPIITLLPILMYWESIAVYGRIEKSFAAQQAVRGYVLGLTCGSIALFFGGFIIMGCLRGTRGPNRYGPAS